MAVVLTKSEGGCKHVNLKQGSEERRVLTSRNIYISLQLFYTIPTAAARVRARVW
jgi:hypothetical protein